MSIDYIAKSFELYYLVISMTLQKVKVTNVITIQQSEYYTVFIFSFKFSYTFKIVYTFWYITLKIHQFISYFYTYISKKYINDDILVNKKFVPLSKFRKHYSKWNFKTLQQNF